MGFAAAKLALVVTALLFLRVSTEDVPDAGEEANPTPPTYAELLQSRDQAKAVHEQALQRLKTAEQALTEADSQAANAEQNSVNVAEERTNVTKSLAKLSEDKAADELRSAQKNLDGLDDAIEKANKLAAAKSAERSAIVDFNIRLAEHNSANLLRGTLFLFMREHKCPDPRRDPPAGTSPLCVALISENKERDEHTMEVGLEAQKADNEMNAAIEARKEVEKEFTQGIPDLNDLLQQRKNATEDLRKAQETLVEAKTNNAILQLKAEIVENKAKWAQEELKKATERQQKAEEEAKKARSEEEVAKEKLTEAAEAVKEVEDAETRKLQDSCEDTLFSCDSPVQNCQNLVNIWKSRAIEPTDWLVEPDWHEFPEAGCPSSAASALHSGLFMSIISLTVAAMALA